MAREEYFQGKNEAQPVVYAYEHTGVPSHNGCIKVGYTTRDADSRIAEQNRTAQVNYKLLRVWPAMRADGTSFTDHDVHRLLDAAHYPNVGGEWYRCRLARRWESAMLVNVDNITLQRLLGSPEAMQALMSIEGFRSLNEDIETIINKSEKVKNAKKKGDKLSKKEREKLMEEEKEYRSRRDEIRQKLIKFATRIPVFMYLTDNREYCLKDVISQLEPELFRKVTGLKIADFELLVSLGVFNDELMNDAVYKFKRYEDSSLVYTGIDTHQSTVIGLWDTVVDTRDVESTGVFRTEPVEPVVERGHKEPEVSAKHQEPLAVGDRVIHKSLGEGEVESIDDKYLFFHFGDRTRKFLLHEAFARGYLSRP